jgi:hypothetical protein
MLIVVPPADSALQQLAILGSTQGTKRKAPGPNRKTEVPGKLSHYEKEAILRSSVQ